MKITDAEILDTGSGCKYTFSNLYTAIPRSANLFKIDSKSNTHFSITNSEAIACCVDKKAEIKAIRLFVY